MIWWASRPSRARNERSGIAELEESNDWLRNVAWRITDKGMLCADFEVIVLGEPIALEITYPWLFPDVPPQVRPKDKVRLSGHQYGAGGELCLEYRPDNWEPSFNGAMMIESAYRLLTGENPALGETAEVASSHRTTVAQDARSSIFRFLLSAEARHGMLEAPMQTPVEAEIVEHRASGCWLAFPRRIGDAERSFYASGSIPSYMARKGYFIRLPAASAMPVVASYQFVEALVDMMAHEEAKPRLVKSDEELIFVVECAGEFTFMTVTVGAGERTVIGYQTIDMPTTAVRLPSEYAKLDKASVAIVGCGSMGSKVAASLARAGIGKLVLIDGDLLLPENLVRNDLDWGAVGLNKPDGVKRRVEKISPSIKVVVRRLELGGQESTAATDSALTQAGSCDVIVDATSDPQVFNLCGAVARNERKVLVWGEVFAGGVGGIIARLRPDADPLPHAARRQVLEWCADRGKAPPDGAEVQYELTFSADAPPLVADDADVTVIAGHLAKITLDALVHTETTFPQSAYAIGLRAGWIFGSPFDTWPIELRSEGEWGPQKDEHLSEQLDAFVAEFFPQLAADEAE